MPIENLFVEIFLLRVKSFSVVGIGDEKFAGQLF